MVEGAAVIGEEIFGSAAADAAATAATDVAATAGADAAAAGTAGSLATDAASAAAYDAGLTGVGSNVAAGSLDAGLSSSAAYDAALSGVGSNVGSGALDLGMAGAGAYDASLAGVGSNVGGALPTGDMGAGALSAAGAPATSAPGIPASAGQGFSGAPLGDAGAPPIPEGGAPTGAPTPTPSNPEWLQSAQPPVTQTVGQGMSVPTPAGGNPIQSALDWVGNNKLTTAGLGMTGMNLMNQSAAQKKASDFANQMKQLGAPMTAASNDLIARWQSGQLTPSDQHSVDQFRQQQKAQVQQYYASAGLGNSSMAQDAIAKVDSAADAMASTIQESYLKTAASTASAGNAPVIAGIQQQVQQDQSLQQAQAQMLQSLALMSMMNKGG